jgi:hypothetical protein
MEGSLEECSIAPGRAVDVLLYAGPDALEVFGVAAIGFLRWVDLSV